MRTLQQHVGNSSRGVSDADQPRSYEEKPMTRTFCVVSGADPDKKAKQVFVWRRDRVAGREILLGNGYVVGGDGGRAPPGISVGQYSVSVFVPDNCSAEDIFVTVDKEIKAPLPGAHVTFGRTGEGVG